jgi:class 3 adenylate cyclase
VSVLVSEATRARCGGEFEFTAATPLPVAGKPEPVATFIPSRIEARAPSAEEPSVLSGAVRQPVR